MCAAPGSWCQVATEKCPVNSLIIGVDIVKMKPLPNVITFQSDITTEHCRSELRSYMKTWKADVVMHDGAPNVGKDWTQDAFTQSELVLQSLKLAVEYLTVGGTFVTKVFRSKDYNKLMWVFQQFFEKVEATKPPASRNVSAEIFVVCRKFKAPKKFDPKLLDASVIFEDIEQVTNESLERLLSTEKKKRKRDGYEEGDYLLFHDASALEFIKSKEPVQMLATLNALKFDKSDPDLKKVKMLDSTSPELLECLNDLKVLGRREFRLLLKWRKEARELLEIDKKPETEEKEEEEQPIDEEEKIDQELEGLQEKERLNRKRDKRRLNEKKQKEITRMQMDMVSDMRIGLENNEQDSALFDIKQAERSGKLQSLMKGKNALISTDEREDMEVDGVPVLKYKYEDRSDDEIVDDYEAEMDAMYEDFKERQSEKKSSHRAKKARENGYDDDWYGIKEGDSDAEEEDDGVRIANDDSDDDWESDEEGYQNNILNTLTPATTSSGLSSKAALFFNDPLFRDVDMSASTVTASNGKHAKKDDKPVKSTPTNGVTSTDSHDIDSEDEIDYLSESDDGDDKDDWNEDDEENNDPAPDIVTPQAMTIAHELALGHISKQRLLDDSFSKYSFNDRDGLPAWFLDDEEKHNRIIKPITKEASEAIKAKVKALNARPIKKVAEAKARKQMRRARRLEKLRKKTESINEDGALTERDKAQEIEKLTQKFAMGSSKKSKKKEKPKVTLVVARGGNRGLQGRPKGVKGKYKMVDGTMKKEQRALRRIQKKRK